VRVGCGGREWKRSLEKLFPAFPTGKRQSWHLPGPLEQLKMGGIYSASVEVAGCTIEGSQEAKTKSGYGLSPSRNHKENLGVIEMPDRWFLCTNGDKV
jgi:hypothetical protein